jgi:hypothetical protein
MTANTAMHCRLCDGDTTRPALIASIDQRDVACVCEEHGVGPNAYTDAPAIVNRFLLLVGQDHPDHRIRIRDSTGRYLQPPRRF